MKDINSLKQSQPDNNAVIASCPTHLLSKDDQGLLEKGDFLFAAGHYESSCKSFETVLAKMEHQCYFDEMPSADVAALYSDVNGKNGQIQLKLGSFDLAIVYFGRQLSLAEEEDLYVPRMCALIGLGMCYFEKSDFLYAESFFQRALELCVHLQDGTREKEILGHLQKCCEGLNRPTEAEAYARKIMSMDTTSWTRESGGTAVSRRSVGKAIHDLELLRNRLVDTTARTSHVIRLEVASAHRVQLQRSLLEKEQLLKETTEKLSESNSSSVELQDLLEDIDAEIYDAKHAKTSRVKSYLLNSHAQEVKAAELLVRLDTEKSIVKEKLDECLTDIEKKKILIHNTKDDIRVFRDELEIEQGQLIQHILKKRTFRCIALNAANISCDDVTGSTKYGVPYLSVCEDESCYVHCLRTGKLDNVFVGNEEATVATITALFFYENRVYTGTKDCMVIGWDITASATSSSKKLFEAKGHEATVTCIHADDIKVLSGSADKNIIVWSTEGILLRCVGGHTRGVHCIQCGPSWAVTSSYGTVYVWNVLAEKNDNDETKIKEVCDYLE